MKPTPASSAALEPLATRDDLAALLKISPRELDRLRAGGKLPPPDLYLGRSPRWKHATIGQWINRGGEP